MCRMGAESQEHVTPHQKANKDKLSHVDVKCSFPSLNLRFFQITRSCTAKHSTWDLVSFAFLFILLLPNLQWKECNAADATDNSRLRKDLLQGYDKNSRPIQNHQNSTVIKFNIFLKGFDFDERRSVFTVYAWTVLTWIDEHIKWDPKSYGNLTRIHFASHELWQPDLSVFNNLDKSEIDHFGNTRILAYSTGQLVWVPPTKFQVGCSSDLRNWPMDTQVCYVVIGSWAHDGSLINMRLPTNQTMMDTSDLLKNREWDLIETGIWKRDHYFQSLPGVPFPDILMMFAIQREGATHKAGIVVPGLAIAIGVLLAFWIQPGATERLILLLVCIVNNTMYLSYIYRTLPNNGNSVPLVLLFYRDSLFMISVALIWTVCLRYLAATKRTSPVPLPGWLTSFLSSFPAKILCLDPRPNAATQNDVRAGEGGQEGQDTGKLVSGGNPYQEDWAWLAHLLDRVAFVIYLILYLCFYLALL